MMSNHPIHHTAGVARSPFIWRVRIAPDDIDPQDHVSNVAIVGYMSAAAWQHSKALGFAAAEYLALGGMWVVKRHEIDYHAQAMLGDELLCHTWPSGLAKASAERRHRIIRVADSALIAEGLNVWAYLDAATGRPARIPSILREAFDPANFV